MLGACVSEHREGVWYQRPLLAALCACPFLQTAASVAQGSLDTVKLR